VQFQKQFFRYVTAPSFGDPNSVIALGADSAPTTAFGASGTPPAAAPSPPTYGKITSANVDNILSCRIGSSIGVDVKRIAVAQCGPSGAASSTANLYVWDGLTQHWYLVNASAVTLPNNQVVWFDAVSLCEGNPGNNGNATNASLGGADYMLVVIANAMPTAGSYSFAMSAQLNTQ
jgi:hypothetical protein